jgi:isopenicillin N synthase-like dioxygenase
VTSTRQLPVIDLAPLVGDTAGRADVARAIRAACQEFGFFYVAGHGVDPALVARLDALSRQFFALPLTDKEAIAMARGGRAWRGYFPVGGELTSGRPDQKEGLYLGTELPANDPRVRAGLPLHGANLFPAQLPALRPTVLAYIDAVTRVGHGMLEGIAESLDLPAAYFRDGLCRDPTLLFRIFRYPPLASDDARAAPLCGVGEHTDYGLLTLLLQDEVGGLEVHTPGGWLAAPPIAGTFVCNLGDMLERMTAGRYRSTPHRVRNTSGRERLSFPLFFDPSWDAQVRPILPGTSYDDRHARWDGRSVFDLEGTYGEYLLAKVRRVFPELERSVL